MSKSDSTTVSKILVAATLVAAAGLRLWRLSGDLCADEILSLATAAKPWGELFAYAARDWVHPPGYYLVLKPWCGLFGYTEFAVRLLSALCGAFSAALIYRLGAALGSSRAGMLAAALTALSPVHIFYSQLGRAYSLEVAWILALLCSAILWSQNPKAKHWPLLTGVCAAATVATHLLGWLAVCAATTRIWYRLPHERKRWLVWLAFCLSISILWMAYALPMARQFGTELYTGWISRPSPLAVLRTLQEFHGWRPSEPSRSIASATILLFWLLPFLPMFRRRATVSGAQWLLAWVMFPLTVLWLASVLVPMYVTRYVLWCAPVYYLALALAADSLRAPLLRTFWTTAVVASSLASSIHQQARPVRVPVDAAIAHTTQWPASLPIVAERTYLMNPLWRAIGALRPVRVWEPNPLLVPPRTLEITQDELLNFDEIGILCYTGQTLSGFEQLLSPHYELIEQHRLAGIGQEREPKTLHVLRYRRRQNETLASD